MSGHSKWANIKIKKGKTDAARGSIFTKIGREIAVAVKAGGPDPSLNSKLRDVIAKAKQNNMPNDTINRSIKKASGELGAIYAWITRKSFGKHCKTISKNTDRLSITPLLLQEFTFIRSVSSSTMP